MKAHSLTVGRRGLLRRLEPHHLEKEGHLVRRQGGGLLDLVGAGVDYRRRSFGSWDLMVSARYDLHRFTTAELQDRGFTQSQSVQRASLSLGFARSTP